MSALNSEQVQGAGKVSEAPLEGWSRGCRRAHVSFWFWQWFRLSPLAPRKKNRCPSRSARKSWTPASTSNLAERACLPWQGGPAPIQGVARAATRPLPKEIVYLTCPSYSGLAIFRVPEEITCLEIPSQFLVRWPSWPLVPHAPILSCPNPSMTSSVDLRLSASATNRCVTRTISRPCAHFPGARIAANPANNRLSPSQDSGRCACHVPTKVPTPSRIRSARARSTEPTGLRRLCAAARFEAIRPSDCTDRSLDRC